MSEAQARMIATPADTPPASATSPGGVTTSTCPGGGTSS